MSQRALPVTDESAFASLFNFLPIGAYRSTVGGQMLRANPALVRLNGYSDEAELLVGCQRHCARMVR